MSFSSAPYQRHTTSNPYEDKFGYSRAVRKGNHILVSGTTAVSKPELSFASSSPASAAAAALAAAAAAAKSSSKAATLTAQQRQDDDEIKVLHPESAYLQTIVIFKEALCAVEALGGKKEDVVNVRMYVRDKADSGEVGRAMRECLGDVGPAATMILGVGFVHEDMRVEIELAAITD